jgi:ABC-2 type transport system ATP-binding protein
MPVIEVSNLTKAFRTYKKQPGFSGAIKGLFRRQYEQTVAVNEVSFKIEPGELVGFLGPNGAGKTTTLKMLAGLLYPTSGSAKVLGYTPWERDDGYRRQFALVLGQKNQLWWDLPARESLELNAKIYGISKDRFEQTVGELTELLNVKDKLNVSVRELSRRCCTSRKSFSSTNRRSAST